MELKASLHALQYEMDLPEQSLRFNGRFFKRRGASLIMPLSRRAENTQVTQGPAPPIDGAWLIRFN